ncbi:MAG: hypothetical protein GXP32_02285 [Kiritimatiellaeota bacterium]|nr:hypothetical protein [Kiritimatiellota bacterium]
MRITVNVDKTLITLRDGSLFGEMAVISEDYRGAIDSFRMERLVDGMSP